MESTLVKQELDEIVTNIHQAKHADLLAGQDMKLKKLLVFDFVFSLLKDESLNLYKTQDIIMIALVFWSNEGEAKQYSEQRIQDLLTEPVQQNHFIHFQKQLKDRDLAYKFILESIYVALENNWMLQYAYEKMLKEMREEGSKSDLMELPMKKRELESLKRILVN